MCLASGVSALPGGSRRAARVAAPYSLTPLLKAETYLVADLAGSSLFVNPVVRYNVATNVDVAVGGQLVAAGRRGEFRGLPRLFFAQFDVHF
jgi:hypothetical protein